MHNSKRSCLLPSRDALFVAASAAPFALWLLLKHLNRDLWYDELYTLGQFVCVPFGRTATNYVAPNNHILFSLMANAWLKLMGIGGVAEAMDAVWKLRLLCLAPTAGALAYTYATARRLAPRTGWLAVLLLATTIPFFNFALQFRGYVWSMFFLCGVLHHLVRLEARPRTGDALAVGAFALAALYTIPLNLYAVAAIGLVCLGEGLLVAERRAFAVRAVAALAAALALAALLYAPVMSQLLGNPTVKSGGPFRLDTLSRVLPTTLLYFVSERYLLVVLAAAGLLGSFRSIRGSTSESGRWPWRLGALLLLPFVLSFVRGDRPFLRVFVNLAPVFAILAALLVQRALDQMLGRRGASPWVAVCLIAYCYLSFALGMVRISSHLRSDITAGRKSQDIYFNYYQAHYAPSRVAQLLATAARREPAPVVCWYLGDKVAAPQYLARQGIAPLRREALGPVLRDVGRAYVFTAFPQRFTSDVRRRGGKLAVRRLNAEPSFLNAFVVTADR